MDILRLLNTPRRARLPSEIPETPTHLLQQTTTSFYADAGSPDSPPPLSTPLPSHLDTTRDLRLQIKAALLFKIPYKDICAQFNVTERQIRWAKRHRVTPQKNKCGGKVKLMTPQRNTLDSWIAQSPSHRRIALHKLPRNIPQLCAGEKAIRTALQTLQYSRRRSPRKGFSENPRVIAERLAFAREAINWTRDELFNTMFTDEVWANGGAHTTSYVTIKKGENIYEPEFLTHKYSKQPRWMFWGSIIHGRKGPSRAWNPEWGNICAQSYIDHILEFIAPDFAIHDEWRLIQDGAPSHRARLTQNWLRQRGIRVIKWPAYSPDLNIIEHVWNWMRNWIEEHYWKARYDPSNIDLDELRRIIYAAWDAVPDSYIEDLYNSWWRRCQAVIDAEGGPTKY
jgi:DDE superfamily endonuclease